MTDGSRSSAVIFEFPGMDAIAVRGSQTERWAGKKNGGNDGGRAKKRDKRERTRRELLDNGKIQPGQITRINRQTGRLEVRVKGKWKPTS
jgi:hypothetical protein